LHTVTLVRRSRTYAVGPAGEHGVEGELLSAQRTPADDAIKEALGIE
jgi:hypothetical protein